MVAGLPGNSMATGLDIVVAVGNMLVTDGNIAVIGDVKLVTKHGYIILHEVDLRPVIRTA